MPSFGDPADPSSYFYLDYASFQAHGCLCGGNQKSGKPNKNSQPRRHLPIKSMSLAKERIMLAFVPIFLTHASHKCAEQRGLVILKTKLP
jgi:hypothetical protein